MVEQRPRNHVRVSGVSSSNQPDIVPQEFVCPAAEALVEAAADGATWTTSGVEAYVVHHQVPSYAFAILSLDSKLEGESVYRQPFCP